MSTVDDEQDEQHLTRKQRREQARAERKGLEESERVSERRRRRIFQVGAAVLVAIVAVVIVIVAASGGGKKHSATGTKDGSGLNANLQVTPGPWPPEYNGLATRLQALHLPGQSDVAYHVHAVLRVYVNGQRYTVPPQIGIDSQEEFIAPLHTHDTSGIIHQEASEPYPFTLGMFFTVWGVKFTKTQLGSWVAGNGNVLSTYVNGTLVADGPGYRMRPHDDIVVGYGKPGSFPKSFKYDWASTGL
jgi:hypothetical protein